ncbi:MAG: alanine racemase [Burkholderiales bacterium]
MNRPIRARIDLAALAHNLLIARRCAPRSQVLAVIKANAYGHGLLRAARALQDADGFAVLDLEAAVCLRESGFRRHIVLLQGFFAPDELPLIAENRLTVVIHHQEQIAMLASAWLPVKIDVFLKINTGMNRLGFKPSAFSAALRALQTNRLIGDITLMTHFASADEAEGTMAQLNEFTNLRGDSGLPCSMANSAAILSTPATHAEWVRPGIMLYGASPFPDRAHSEFGLLPAMTLSSEIIAVQQLDSGDAVGYGANYRSDGARRVGVVACGYADGYPRLAPTGTPALVAGQLTQTLGRVSMDMLCVDLSALPQAGVGAPVVLWGEGLAVDEVARKAGTLGYELLCALAPRVPVIES